MNKKIGFKKYSPDIHMKKGKSTGKKNLTSKKAKKKKTPRKNYIDSLIFNANTKSFKSNIKKKKLFIDQRPRKRQTEIPVIRKPVFETSIYDNYKSKKRSYTDLEQKPKQKEASKSKNFYASFDNIGFYQFKSKSKSKSKKKEKKKDKSRNSKFKSLVNFTGPEVKLKTHESMFKSKSKLIINKESNISQRKASYELKKSKSRVLTKQRFQCSISRSKSKLKDFNRNKFMTNNISKGRLHSKERFRSLSKQDSNKHFSSYNFTAKSRKNTLARYSKNPTNNKFSNYHFTSKNHKGFNYYDIAKNNQDAIFIHNKFIGFEKMHLIGVCDGHGKEGEVVSQYIAENFPKNFEMILKTKLIAKNIFLDQKEVYKNNQYEMDIFTALKKTVSELFDTETDVYFSGTTLNCIFIFDDNIISCNVGDSRSILSGSNNFSAVAKLSTDHTPDDPTEKSRIQKKNARIARMKNEDGEESGPLRVWMQNEDQPGLAMTRSIGDVIASQIGITWKPSVLYKQLSRDDEYVILVATDGLWDVFTNEEAVELIRKYWKSTKIEEAGEMLLKECKKRWMNDQEYLRDDISFVIGFIRY